MVGLRIRRAHGPDAEQQSPQSREELRRQSSPAAQRSRRALDPEGRSPRSAHTSHGMSSAPSKPAHGRAAAGTGSPEGQELSDRPQAVTKPTGGGPGILTRVDDPPHQGLGSVVGIAGGPTKLPTTSLPIKPKE